MRWHNVTHKQIRTASDGRYGHSQRDTTRKRDRTRTNSDNQPGPLHAHMRDTGPSTSPELEPAPQHRTLGLQPAICSALLQHRCSHIIPRQRGRHACHLVRGRRSEIGTGRGSTKVTGVGETFLRGRRNPGLLRVEDRRPGWARGACGGCRGLGHCSGKSGLVWHPPLHPHAPRARGGERYDICTPQLLERPGLL